MKKFLNFIGRGTAAAPPRTRVAPAAGVPAARFDALTVEEVLGHLGGLAPADLATLGAHERAHQKRAPVLDRIDALLDNEPWPGYDELDVTGVRSALDDAAGERLDAVLAYERAHKQRAGVLLAAQQHPAQGSG